MDKNAANIITTLTISVGKRGTNPVFKNSKKTGINKTKDIIPRANENVPKNFNGL